MRGQPAVESLTSPSPAASDDPYRQFFAANPLPMWLYDPETLRFLDVNEAAVQQYGYSRDEFLAMTIADIRPPEELGALYATLGPLAAEAQQSGPWRHRTKDGTIIEVEVSSRSATVAGAVMAPSAQS